MWKGNFLSGLTKWDNRSVRDWWWLRLVVLAVALRLVLSAFVYHTDLKGVYHEAALISQYGWVGGYEEGLKENTPLHYPPPVYFIIGSYERYGGFLFTTKFRSWVHSTDLRVAQYKGVFGDLVAMKLPVLALDLMITWMLAKSVEQGKRRLIAFLWLFNPFTLYVIYGTSHFDIIPTMLVLASMFLFGQRKTVSYTLLGLAAGFKVFPVLLLPFWLVVDERQWSVKLRDLAVAIAVFAVCLLPIARSSGALQSVFLSNLTGGVTRAAVDIGSNESLPLYPVFYGGFLLMMFLGYAKRVPLEAIPVVVLGILFGLGSFHPQWMLWLMPFLVLLVVNSRVKWKLALFTMLAFLGVVFLIDDIYMTFGILSPLNAAFTSLPTLRYLMDNVGMGVQLQGVFHAFFLVGILMIAAGVLGEGRTGLDLKRVLPKGLGGLTVGVVSILVGIFLMAEIYLSVKGSYVDREYRGYHGAVALTAKTTVRQDFSVEHDNFMGLGVVMKNAGLKSKDDIYFDLSDRGSGVNLAFKINGGAIGDDYNLRLNFKRIKQSLGHHYTLSISSSGLTASSGGSEMLVPFGGEEIDGLYLNGQRVSGNLAYTVYYNPGGLVENLKYTLSQTVSKI